VWLSMVRIHISVSSPGGKENGTTPKRRFQQRFTEGHQSNTREYDDVPLQGISPVRMPMETAWRAACDPVGRMEVRGNFAVVSEILSFDPRFPCCKDGGEQAQPLPLAGSEGLGNSSGEVSAGGGRTGARFGVEHDQFANNSFERAPVCSGPGDGGRISATPPHAETQGLGDTSGRSGREAEVSTAFARHARFSKNSRASGELKPARRRR